MRAQDQRWSLSDAAAILLPYTLRGLLLSFLYLILPAIARANGTSLAMTTLSTLVFVPIGLTWLWAPVMDRGASCGRRFWIVGALLLASVAFAALACLDPVTDYAAVLAIALLVAAAGGTIGTATDAAIIDGVAPRHRGWANALQATGVALGGLAVGGVGIAYGAYGWASTSLLMVLLAAAGAAATALGLGKLLSHSLTGTGRRATPAASLLRDAAARQTLLIVVLSRAGLHLPMGILAAFQIDAGLSVAVVALIGGAGGAVASLIGAVIGGAVATHLAPRPAIIATLGVSAIASAGIGVLIALWGATPVIAVALATYVFLLTTPVFVAMHRHFMLVVRPGHHASDMSVLTGTEFLAGLMIAANAGWIAQIGGYALLFVFSSVSALAGMLLAWRILGSRAAQASCQSQDAREPEQQ